MMIMITMIAPRHAPQIMITNSVGKPSSRDGNGGPSVNRTVHHNQLKENNKNMVNSINTSSEGNIFLSTAAFLREKGAS